MQNCSSFLNFFLKNRSSINLEIKNQLSSKKPIWYYNPFTSKIEFISLKEIVNDFVTDNFNDLLDPTKAICGIGISIGKDNEIGHDPNLYHKFKIEERKNHKKNDITNFNSETRNVIKTSFFQNKKRKKKNKEISKSKQTVQQKKTKRSSFSLPSNKKQKYSILKIINFPNEINNFKSKSNSKRKKNIKTNFPLKILKYSLIPQQKFSFYNTTLNFDKKMMNTFNAPIQIKKSFFQKSN